MFIQPDWWEVMRAGVGTNRYSYSFNDPVTGRDPSGHAANSPGLFDRGGFFDRVFGGDNRRTDSDGDGINDWAEYQRDAANAGGALSFDKYKKMTGIDLRAGMGGYGVNVRVSASGAPSLDFPLGGVKVPTRFLGKLLGWLSIGQMAYNSLNYEPQYVYHYTTLEAAAAIYGCQCFIAAQPTLPVHPSGAYFTGLAPGSMTKYDLAVELYRYPTPKIMKKLAAAVVVDVNGIPRSIPDPTRPHISVVVAPPGTLINMPGRIKGYGATP